MWRAHSLPQMEMKLSCPTQKISSLCSPLSSTFWLTEQTCLFHQGWNLSLPEWHFFFFLAFCTILFSPFNHNNMISKFYLNRRVCKHRFSQPTHKQGKRFFLKWSRHGISGHPTQVSPWLALSSQHCAATSLNLIPDFNFSMASIIFPCFSHWMCLTFTPLPPCGTVSLLVRTVTPGGCSPSLPFPGIAFSLGQHLWNLQLNSQLQCGIFFF